MVEIRHGEALVRLVLPYAIRCPNNFLIGAADDEIRRIHGNDVSRELNGKVVVRLQFLPIQIAEQILGLFQSVRHVALRYLQTAGQ